MTSRPPCARRSLPLAVVGWPYSRKRITYQIFDAGGAVMLVHAGHQSVELDPETVRVSLRSFEYALACSHASAIARCKRCMAHPDGIVGDKPPIVWIDL